jgi:Ferritin-like domain
LHEMNRGQFLRLGLAGAVGTAGAGVLAGPAAAALPAPAPKGDDVGYLAFGAVAEQTSRAWYRRALTVHGFSAGERRRLTAAARAKAAHLQRINAVLGADAIRPGDFGASFPASAFCSRVRAAALGARIEELLVSVYLTGAAFASDNATRLLLGRLLAFDAQQLAWIRGLTGALPASGLPVPQTVEQAGTVLDGLVTTPNFPG